MQTTFDQLMSMSSTYMQEDIVASHIACWDVQCTYTLLCLKGSVKALGIVEVSSCFIDTDTHQYPASVSEFNHSMLENDMAMEEEITFEVEIPSDYYEE